MTRSLVALPIALVAAASLAEAQPSEDLRRRASQARLVREMRSALADPAQKDERSTVADRLRSAGREWADATDASKTQIRTLRGALGRINRMQAKPPGAVDAAEIQALADKLEALIGPEAQALIAELQTALFKQILAQFAAAQAQESSPENNEEPFLYGGRRYGWGLHDGHAIIVPWGSPLRVEGNFEAPASLSASCPAHGGGSAGGAPRGGGSAGGASRGGGSAGGASRGGGSASGAPRGGGSASGGSTGGGAPPVAPPTGGKGTVNYQGKSISDPLVRTVLQRIADHYGRTVLVTSGDRSYVPRGGSRTSWHLQGRAADFHVQGVPDQEVFQMLRQNERSILPEHSFEVIWHGPDTNTSGQHLHLANRAPGGTQFKEEHRGSYRIVQQ